MTDAIDVAHGLSGVEYFHSLPDRHEVVILNGAETKSLYAGPEGLQSVVPTTLEEIFSIVPELKNRDSTPVVARPLVKGHKMRHLAILHRKNLQPLETQL